MVAYIRDSKRSISSSVFLQNAKLVQELRQFSCLRRITDAYLQYHREHPEVRRRHAQALIEEGLLTAASDVLTPLTKPAVRKQHKAEHYEAVGLTGRVNKQLYFNGVDYRKPRLLESAIASYQKGYGNDPKKRSWHGVNTAALLAMAARDRVRLPNLKDPARKAERIAEQIVTALAANRKKSVWNEPTIAEAHLVLGNTEDALHHYSLFAKNKETSAFALGSTLRQVEDIWRLGEGNESERMIVHTLRAALLKKPGGQLDLFANDLDSDELHGLERNKTFEKVLGSDAFNSYQWFVLGTDRAHNVAQIETAAGKSFGTAFLVRGGDVVERFGDDQLLFTNAHVITEHGADPEALSKDQARIRFELLDPRQTYRVDEIVWHSPPDELDATLFRLRGSVGNAKEHYPITQTIPRVNKRRPPRVLIIGHPDGMRLQFSIKDNTLTDAKDPFIHYRAPTMGGSSGSPVFNEEWELIALHHAGGFDIPKLNGEGTHDANEGITMRAILPAVRAALTP